jgi:hypothetical protein
VIDKALGWAGGKLAALAVVAVAVAVVLMSARRAGRNAERVEAQNKVLKDVEARNAVEREVARDPAPADRLRDRWSRRD